MKFTHLLCCFCLILFAPAHAQLQEDFTDGNFTDNPTWNGSTNLWTVVNGQLRSNSPTASSSFYLSTPSTLAVDAQWEFFVKLAFNTSGTNYVDIFLTSDLADLKSTNNGYFVRVGGTKDEVSLYKRTAGINALLIDGIDATTGTSSNTLKIRVSRTLDFTWKLERDVTGTGNSYVVESTKIDSSFTASAYFGFVVQQSTSSFFNKHFLDDIKITPSDRVPPQVQAVNVLDATHLEVLFSEPVTPSSAQTITNYTAYTTDNSLVNPALAAFATGVNTVDPSKIILTFTSEFISEQPYSLTVTNIEDGNNNMLSPQTHSFLYKAPFTPQYRDIIINELMADPTPAVDLPEAEFIELYNVTDQEIDLNGYTLSDGASIAKFGSLSLAPHSYLIVCSTTYASLFTPFGNVAALSSFPSLNNSGETITFKNAAGKIIDVVNYASSWYKDGIKDDGGWTLEQVNPMAVCNNSNNWLVSSHQSGGTPGKQNSIYSTAPDQVAPTLLSLQILTDNQIQLLFSETMDSLLLKNAKYEITDDLFVTYIQTLAPGYTSVRLTLNQNLLPGRIYSITPYGLADCPGNMLSPITFTFGKGAEPQYGQVIITEIMADETPAAELPEAEFIELYNPSNRLLSLAGMAFIDDNGTVKLPDVVMYPNDYLILCASANVDKFRVYGKAISVSGFSLNNSGETLLIKNKNNQLIHSVKYSSDWYGNREKENGGWSLEMIDISYACVESGNWLASENASGGTPGIVNSVQASKPDLTAPQLIKIAVEDATHLQVYFNEKLDSATACLVNLYAVAEHPVEQATFTSTGLNQIRLTLANPLVPKQLYTLSVQNIRDCSGNIAGLLTSGTFALSEQADSADIIINEVLFNSRTGGVDFVEIFNRSDKYINLKNWQLANMENDTIADLKLITAADELIAPFAYKVFTISSQILKEHYPNAKQENFWPLASMPSYPDDAGTIVLINNLQQLSDKFEYSENMHFSLIDDVSGVSLERISPDAATNSPSSWHSAASTEGFATPGYRNSQLLANKQSKATFSINPQVFTPDEDGYQDFTTINYLLENHGNMATIIIYDAQGRQVRTVANNQLLSTGGFYSWDGTNERGEKVLIGRYIVYISLYTITGKVQHFKESVVVGAKF